MDKFIEYSPIIEEKKDNLEYHRSKCNVKRSITFE